MRYLKNKMTGAILQYEMETFVEEEMFDEEDSQSNEETEKER